MQYGRTSKAINEANTPTNVKKATKALNESIERQERNNDEINLYKPKLEGKEKEIQIQSLNVK